MVAPEEPSSIAHLDGLKTSGTCQTPLSMPGLEPPYNLSTAACASKAKGLSDSKRGQPQDKINLRSTGIQLEASRSDEPLKPGDLSQLERALLQGAWATTANDSPRTNNRRLSSALLPFFSLLFNARSRGGARSWNLAILPLPKHLRSSSANLPSLELRMARFSGAIRFQNPFANICAMSTFTPGWRAQNSIFLDIWAPSSEAIRPVHKAKRTRRLPLGRTAAGPPQGNSLRPTYSGRPSDSTLSYADKAFPTSFTYPSPNHQESNHMPQHQTFQVSENPSMSRQKRATAEVIEVNASTITVETMPPRPREPYFVLNPEFTSIDKKHPAYARPRHNQDFSQSRHVPSTTIPRRSYDLVGELVGAGLEFASNLNFPHAQPPVLSTNMSSAAYNIPPSIIPSTRVEDVRPEDPSTITVAKTPGRRRSESGNTHKREGSTIYVYQKPAQIFKENLPIHISPKKRKADASDTQPRGKEPSAKQRPEGSPTLAPERETSGLLFSNQPRDGYQPTPLGDLSKNQSHRPSDDQISSQLRNSKKARASDKLMPMIEVALAKANEQLENHTLPIQDDGGGQKPAYASPLSQQLELKANELNDEQESMAAAPPFTVETDVSVENDSITVAIQNAAEPSIAAEPRMAEQPRTAKARVFDSEAFDAMIYRQSTLHPPPGVSVQAPARPNTPVQKPSIIEDQSQYLAINPAIHFSYNRSEEWYKEKALEIQARGGRKAWFGKVIERRRWLRAKEKAEDERNASIQEPTRIDPRPWSYDRIIDFGDVPEEELPEDVLQNPAWVKACAWHRENQAKRILRDRAARDANREAWSQAERIMEDAKLASQRSREKH